MTDDGSDNLYVILTYAHLYWFTIWIGIDEKQGYFFVIQNELRAFYELDS